jgi:TRAP-type C4-dicarboxylate transport system substrate-binding protein
VTTPAALKYAGRRVRLWLLLALSCLPGMARAAEPQTTLRLATVAPDGTAWAHLSRDFATEVPLHVHGAAATAMCDQLAPSMKITNVVGLIQSRAENTLVLHNLRPDLEKEMHQSGFVPLVVGGFGSTILFSRTPVRSMEELRALRAWAWVHEPVLIKQMQAMGLHPQPLTLEDAGPAYDDKKIDGFFTIPTAALAFQWSSRARYFLDLRAAFLDGCLVLTERAFFKLSASQQQVLKHAGDKLAHAFEVASARQDEQLTGGLLQKQGVQKLEFGGTFRAEFLSDARRARDQIVDTLMPRALLTRVTSWLADFRAEHPND